MKTPANKSKILLAFVGSVFFAAATNQAQSAAIRLGTTSSSTPYTQSFGIDNVSAYATAIPEPQTCAMIVGGLGMLLLLQRRRSRKYFQG